MTYASIILPYDLKKNEVNENPKTTPSLKGKFTSAMKKGGTAIKNAIQNPGDTFKTLGKYMQDNQDAILNKFSGIAVAQILADGKVTNQEALDYLFLGFAPALDRQAIAMGYSGTTQMKDAIKNGSINVGSFVSGFSKVQKTIVDFKNGQKNKNEQKANNIIELDVTLNHNEQYQSETPDRRVEDGISYAEVLHNMPEIFSLECGFSELKGRYTLTEFKGYLTQLRDSKQVFSMTIGDAQIDNLVLQNFSPSVMGARSGLDYTLELKKIHVGSVELTPITIQKAPQPATENTNQGIGAGIGIGNVSGSVSTPDFILDPLKKISKMLNNQSRSVAKQVVNPK